MCLCFVLQSNYLVFMAELFWWFEVVKPSFVQHRILDTNGTGQLVKERPSWWFYQHARVEHPPGTDASLSFLQPVIKYHPAKKWPLCPVRWNRGVQTYLRVQTASLQKVIYLLHVINYSFYFPCLNYTLHFPYKWLEAILSLFIAFTELRSK